MAQSSRERIRLTCEDITPPSAWTKAVRGGATWRSPAWPVIWRKASTACAMPPATPQWPKDSRPPCVFSGSAPPAAKSPSHGALCGAAARGEADLLEQHGQRDGEGVVDAQVVDVGQAQPCLVERALRRLGGAALHHVLHGRQVLVAVRLAGARHGHARPAPRALPTPPAPWRRRRSGSNPAATAARQWAWKPAPPASVMGVRRCASGCLAALARISTANSARSAEVTPVALQVARRHAARSRPARRRRWAPRNRRRPPAPASGWSCRATGR